MKKVEKQTLYSTNQLYESQRLLLFYIFLIPKISPNRSS